MANHGVNGRIVDSGGAGIAGLYVAAFDAEALFGDTLLKNLSTANDPLFPGWVQTANDGSFAILYSEGAYGLEGKPDLLIRVYSNSKRLIYTGAVQRFAWVVGKERALRRAW